MRVVEYWRVSSVKVHQEIATVTPNEDMSAHEQRQMKALVCELASVWLSLHGYPRCALPDVRRHSSPFVEVRHIALPAVTQTRSM